MISNRPIRILAQPLIAASLLAAAAAPAFTHYPSSDGANGGVTVIERTVANTEPSVSLQPTPAAFVRAPSPEAATLNDVRLVVETFVWGLSNGRADIVWKYATEEEQSGLQSEGAVLSAFKEAYPPLAHARDLVYKGTHTEGDVPFVSFYVKDKLGLQWLTTFGLYFDDAGDWRIVSLEITGAPGELI